MPAWPDQTAIQQLVAREGLLLRVDDQATADRIQTTGRVPASLATPAWRSTGNRELCLSSEDDDWTRPSGHQHRRTGPKAIHLLIDPQEQDECRAALVCAIHDAVCRRSRYDHSMGYQTVTGLQAQIDDLFKGRFGRHRDVYFSHLDDDPFTQMLILRTLDPSLSIPLPEPPGLYLPVRLREGARVLDWSWNSGEVGNPLDPPAGWDAFRRLHPDFAAKHEPQGALVSGETWNDHRSGPGLKHALVEFAGEMGLQAVVSPPNEILVFDPKTIEVIGPPLAKELVPRGRRIELDRDRVTDEDVLIEAGLARVDWKRAAGPLDDVERLVTMMEATAPAMSGSDRASMQARLRMLQQVRVLLASLAALCRSIALYEGRMCMRAARLLPMPGTTDISPMPGQEGWTPAEIELAVQMALQREQTDKVMPTSRHMQEIRRRVDRIGKIVRGRPDVLDRVVVRDLVREIVRENLGRNRYWPASSCLLGSGDLSWPPGRLAIELAWQTAWGL